MLLSIRAGWSSQSRSSGQATVPRLDLALRSQDVLDLGPANGGDCALHPGLEALRVTRAVLRHLQEEARQGRRDRSVTQEGRGANQQEEHTRWRTRQQAGPPCAPTWASQ